MSNIKCDCGGEYQTLTGQTVLFNAVLAGLDIIYLEHITVDLCRQCGDLSPYFPTADEFFNTIARAVALQPYLSTGPDFRVLRKNRRLKAKAFAALLHIAPATLSRWKDDKQSRSPQNDILVRLLYLQLYNEQETRPFPETITVKLSRRQDRREVLTIWIDTQCPMKYRYSLSEKLAAS
jgi:DNA-binding transcriptional regulator YiaG